MLDRHGLPPIADRPIVIAGVSGSQWGDGVIRRAATLAAEDGDLVVVHVEVDDGLGHGRVEALERYRDLIAVAGGSYLVVQGASPADTLVEEVRHRHAGRVVVARHRSRLDELVRGSVASRIRRLAPGLEVTEVRPES